VALVTRSNSDTTFGCSWVTAQSIMKGYFWGILLTLLLSFTSNDIQIDRNPLSPHPSEASDKIQEVKINTDKSVVYVFSVSAVQLKPEIFGYTFGYMERQKGIYCFEGGNMPLCRDIFETSCTSSMARRCLIVLEKQISERDDCVPSICEESTASYERRYRGAAKGRAKAMPAVEPANRLVSLFQ